MTVDGDFSLEQLLASGVDVGCVGEGEVAAQLLLDNDAGGGVAEGAEVVGIDFDGACSEEFLDAAADGSVESSAEEGVGGGIGESLFLLLRVDALLVLSTSEGEEGNNIGLGERWVAAISNGGLAGGAMEAEGDVVVFNAGSGTEVDDRLDAHRIGERDVAALEVVARAGDDGAAFSDGDASLERRSGEGSAEAQVDVAGELGEGILKIQLRRGKDAYVEANVVGGGVWRGNGWAGVGLRGLSLGPA